MSFIDTFINTECVIICMVVFDERKFNKKLSVSAENEDISERNVVDYCVEGYKMVNFSETYRDLLFGNGCEVQSSIEGNGVVINKKFIKNIKDCDTHIRIYFKGIDDSSEFKGEVLINCEDYE